MDGARVYVWKAPRPSDADEAEALIREVVEAGSAAMEHTTAAAGGRAGGLPGDRAGAPAGTPASGPAVDPAGARSGAPPQLPGRFEASDDVGWFFRELTGDTPPLWNPDAPPKHGPPPNRLVVVPLAPESVQQTLEDVYSLALKYDLVVYDPQRRAVHEPMAEMSAYASATFWPRGAIQAATAGGAGALIAVVAWFVGIPIISGVAVVVGAYLFAMAVLTFVIEGRKRMR